MLTMCIIYEPRYIVIKSNVYDEKRMQEKKVNRNNGNKTIRFFEHSSIQLFSFLIVIDNHYQFLCATQRQTLLFVVFKNIFSMACFELKSIQKASL